MKVILFIFRKNLKEYNIKSALQAYLIIFILSFLFCNKILNGFIASIAIFIFLNLLFFFPTFFSEEGYLEYFKSKNSEDFKRDLIINKRDSKISKILK